MTNTKLWNKEIITTNNKKLMVERFIDNEQMKYNYDSDSGESTDSSVGALEKLNLNCKIHEREFCTCFSLRHIFKRNPNIEIIVSKLYHDNKDEDKYPEFMMIEDKNNFEAMISDVKERSLIFDYFSDHVGNLTDVRKSVESIKTFCYCRGKLMTNPNAGTVLLGCKDMMETISGTFNYYFENKLEEFQRLIYCKLKDIGNLSYNLDHTIVNFTKSTYFDSIIDCDLYTVLGINNTTNTAGFSFGKREYINSSVAEDPYKCAKRELFEEFRFNLSGSLNKFNKNKYYIQYECCRLYPIILPTDTKIRFDDRSKTIIFSI